jgi:hypothetical protein
MAEVWESDRMPRARALVAAVPPRVWTAVAGLVLLASLGVTLVLGAGLATWRGAVTHSPLQGSARPPTVGTTPPGSAVVVVPTPATHHRGTSAPPNVTTATTVTVVPAPVVVARAPAPPVVPAVTPAVAPPVAPPPVTAHPRVTGPASTPGHKAKAHKASVHWHGRGSHGNHGKHLGWAHNKHAA